MSISSASENGHYDVVELLLNGDTNIHTLLSAIELTSSEGHDNVVNLLKSDSRIIDLSKKNPFYQIRNDYVDFFRKH